MIPGDYIDYSTDQMDIVAMFRCMQEHRVAADCVDNKPIEIKGVVEQTEDEYVIASQYDYSPNLIKYLLDCAKDAYNTYFSDEKKFLLHGDAYYKNSLRSHDGIRLIDPVGYVDAFTFEYMPFLTYELVMHSKPEHYMEQYRSMVRFFSSFADVSKFDAAAFIFLVKQLVPSIYEANDDYKRANRYMRLIKALFLEENNIFTLEKCNKRKE